MNFLDVKLINSTGTPIRFRISEESKDKEVAPNEYGILTIGEDGRRIIVEIF